MTGPELFDSYYALPPEQQEQFLNILSMHLSLHLPDAKFLLLTVEEYQTLNRNSQLYLVTKRLMDSAL